MTATLDIDDLSAVFARLPRNPRVVVSGNAATPTSVIGVLDRTVGEYTLHMLNAMSELPDRAGVTLETAFVGPAMRGKANLRYVPCRLSLLPLLYQRNLSPDIVIAHTSVPRAGTVSLGIEVNVLPAAIEAARARGAVVIAAVNPAMPYTGGDAVMRLEDFDFLVEVDDSLLSFAPTEPDQTSLTIGGLISEHIPAGSTLQLGIGGVPDAVLGALGESRDLKIWSETISDGVLTLKQLGALSRDAPVRTSFIMGSARLYEWVDQNPQVMMIRTETCNSPAQIAGNPSMISVNGAIEIDLHGQANASRVRGRVYSGFGGSTDFIVGAIHSAGGQSFMALPSWHPKADTSTIVAALACPATSFQQTAVVTENGIAWLFGASETEQASNLIEHSAHPRARDQLRDAAEQMFSNAW